MVMPRSQYRECIENNEIRRGNNDVSSHILLVLFSISLTLMLQYSASSSVRGADANVLNSLKHSRLSRK